MKEKVLVYGNCSNWQIVETEDGKHHIRCSSTKLKFPVITDEQGGLVIPISTELLFKEESVIEKI